MDSTVTILMVTMAFTVPTMVFTWELVSLVIPVPLLLIPTEVSKELARGLLKKRPLLPRLRLHPLLKLLPFSNTLPGVFVEKGPLRLMPNPVMVIMDSPTDHMVCMVTTIPPSNGPDIRDPDLNALPGVFVDKCNVVS